MQACTMCIPIQSLNRAQHSPVWRISDFCSSCRLFVQSRVPEMYISPGPHLVFPLLRGSTIIYAVIYIYLFLMPSCELSRSVVNTQPTDFMVGGSIPLPIFVMWFVTMAILLVYFIRYFAMVNTRNSSRHVLDQPTVVYHFCPRNNYFRGFSWFHHRVWICLYFKIYSSLLNFSVHYFSTVCTFIVNALWLIGCNLHLMYAYLVCLSSLFKPLLCLFGVIRRHCHD